MPIKTAALCFMSLRKIIHIDMDAFYASIEQRDHPDYRNRPIAVGGLPDQRGVVATASYEARAFGVKSAMASSRAKQLCPQLIFVKPRFQVYKTVSQQIRNIFSRYTDIIEPLSLDEAYLDVTTDKLQIGSAIEIAKQIKDTIREELQLTASAGVSTNKFVAKIASDMQKPDGLTFIGPSKIQEFMENLPIEKFYGIGKATGKKMHDMHLYTGADLKEIAKADLIKHFGKIGNFYYHMVRGIDERPVQPYREIKSISAEDTFEKDLFLLSELAEALKTIAHRVYERLKKNNLWGATLTLKVKYGDFKQITRNYTHSKPIQSYNELENYALALLTAIPSLEKGIRLLGLSISKFPTTKGNQQLTLF